MTDQGILRDLDVLDLSWGIAGPMAGMLLADHGAGVTRIEPPGGDPFGDLSGTRVWLRGKRRATLDLRDDADRDVFLALARRADVVIESFAPGVAERLGIDHARCSTANPRLVHCSITGYGESGAHADRPAIDALVAARTGQQFESRGVVGGTIARLSGSRGAARARRARRMHGRRATVGPAVQRRSVDQPRHLLQRDDRDQRRPRGARDHRAGPARPHVAAAGCARDHGGRVAACRARRPRRLQDVDHRPAGAQGFLPGSDGRWTHHWVPLPAFILNAGDARAARSRPRPAVAARRAHAHLATGPRT